MTSSSPDLTAKIRQQYEEIPYPPYPLSQFPSGNPNEAFLNDWVTPYYRRDHRLPRTSNPTILDVGCGSGYSTLRLAVANPTATIIGIDLSERSIEFAQRRAAYHNLGDRLSFYPLPIAEIGTLSGQFDYINCDEVLYLLADQIEALQEMKSLLKPDGIIHTNLHSRYQRHAFYRGQTLSQYMGLMDDVPGPYEAEIIFDTLQALQNGVELKKDTWRFSDQTEFTPEIAANLLVNFLLQGDKGFTIPELFTILESAGLRLISMTKWMTWDLLSLFKEPDNLPAFWAFNLSNLGVQDILNVYDLINPVHRLLDFWCCAADYSVATTLPSDWSEEAWLTAQVYLQPQLQTAAFEAAVKDTIHRQGTLDLTAFLSVPITGLNQAIFDSTILSVCILPLFTGSQRVATLVNRWLQVQPLNPLTLDPRTPQTCLQELILFLLQLNDYCYVLLEAAE